MTTPKLALVRLPGGCVAQVGTVPVVVARDGRTIVREVSNRYAPLLHFVPDDLAAVLNGAGRWPAGCSCWATKCGRRTTAIGCWTRCRAWRRWRRRDQRTRPWRPAHRPRVSNARRWPHAAGTPPASSNWRRDRRCAPGSYWPPPTRRNRRIRCSRARRGPGAICAGLFGPPDGVATGRRLYICRNDAPGQRVLNEAELVAALALRGFEGVALDGMSVPGRRRCSPRPPGSWGRVGPVCRTSCSRDPASCSWPC